MAIIYWAPVFHFYQPPTQFLAALKKICHESSTIGSWWRKTLGDGFVNGWWSPETKGAGYVSQIGQRRLREIERDRK